MRLMERIFLCMEAQGVEVTDENSMQIFVGNIGDESSKFAQKLVHELRTLGISADYDKMGRSVKAQMKQANKLGCKYSVIIGDNEITEGKIMLKDMTLGESKEIALTAEEIAKNIN